MKKTPPVQFKVGQKVICILPDANGARGTIIENKGVFGTARKQLWKVKFPHAEYDLYSEMLRPEEDK